MNTLELEQPDRESRASFLSAAGPREIRDQLERILSSKTFRTAKREKAFLRYVVEQTIQGRGDGLKEYIIGAEAFDRGLEFDPRRDTIVRTEAWHVRRRLARYYAGEGLADPLQIELPKGGYTPRFVRSRQLEAAEPEIPCNTLPAFKEVQITEVPTSVATPAVARLSLRRMVVFVVAAAVLALGSWWLGHAPPFTRPVGVDAAAIAVLPFQDLGGGSDREGEILSDGITEELIESLARIPRLHVVARSSAFAYKGRSLDIRKAGRELNVRNILDGSIRIANGRVRIIAQLEDTTNGYQLWSQSFDRRFDDVFAVQDEIATAMMRSLGVQLAGAANLKAGASPSPAAYQNFLRGLYFVNRGTAENVRTAVNYFDRAVTSDPSFASAYRGLADGYAKLAAFTSARSLEAAPRIRAAASKALQLDDTLGEAHLDLGRAYMYESNREAAGREFRRALELSPGSAEVHHYYGDYLLRTGRLEEALAEGRIALELDPISPAAANFVARTLYFLRRYNDSIAQLQKALEINPSSGILHQALGLVFMSRSATYQAGIAEYEQARDLMEGSLWTAGEFGYAYAVAGRTAEAREALRQFEVASGGYVRALPVARTYVALGERDLAFLWLQKAVDERDTGLFLDVDPAYDGLRADPRFRALLKRAYMNPVGSDGISPSEQGELIPPAVTLFSRIYL
jgi:TolB-like protein/Tfp pilus assembly protein PilF